MAKGGITVQGVSTVQAALARVMMGVQLGMPKPLKETGTQARSAAKKILENQLDTGALRDSVRSRLAQNGPNTFIQEVYIADNVIRGAGKYKTGRTTKMVSHPTPTTEYADKIDMGHGDMGSKGFMSEVAFKLADRVAPKKILAMVRQIVRGMA